MRDRDAGLSKLNSCVESGERLYASTAPDGREIIRQELRKLKLGWDGLYDDLSSAQRRLEVSLVQWTSFNESYAQVENKLREMESQLDGHIALRSTLEEKKTQHQNFKVRVCYVKEEEQKIITNVCALHFFTAVMKLLNLPSIIFCVTCCSEFCSYLYLS